MSFLRPLTGNGLYIYPPYENGDDWGMVNMDGATIIYVYGIVLATVLRSLLSSRETLLDKILDLFKKCGPNRRVGWAQKWDTPDTPQQNTSKYQ